EAVRGKMDGANISALEATLEAVAQGDTPRIELKEGYVLAETLSQVLSRAIDEFQAQPELQERAIGLWRRAQGRLHGVWANIAGIRDAAVPPLGTGADENLGSRPARGSGIVSPVIEERIRVALGHLERVEGFELSTEDRNGALLQAARAYIEGAQLALDSGASELASK
ncbi:MAG: hypothetical protein Q7T11_00180, partial [Deltaproteobacteria bacterium]|nr:hypothetical protein [Deltaproteobacteria bacterium]